MVRQFPLLGRAPCLCLRRPCCWVCSHVCNWLCSFVALDHMLHVALRFWVEGFLGLLGASTFVLVRNCLSPSKLCNSFRELSALAWPAVKAFSAFGLVELVDDPLQCGYLSAARIWIHTKTHQLFPNACPPWLVGSSPAPDTATATTSCGPSFHVKPQVFFRSLCVLTQTQCLDLSTQTGSMVRFCCMEPELFSIRYTCASLITVLHCPRSDTTDSDTFILNLVIHMLCIFTLRRRGHANGRGLSFRCQSTSTNSEPRTAFRSSACSVEVSEVWIS